LADTLCQIESILQNFIIKSKLKFFCLTNTSVTDDWFRLLKESPSNLLGEVDLIGIYRSVT